MGSQGPQRVLWVVLLLLVHVYAVVSQEPEQVAATPAWGLVGRVAVEANQPGDDTPLSAGHCQGRGGRVSKPMVRALENMADAFADTTKTCPRRAVPGRLVTTHGLQPLDWEGDLRLYNRLSMTCSLEIADPDFELAVARGADKNGVVYVTVAGMDDPGVLVHWVESLRRAGVTRTLILTTHATAYYEGLRAGYNVYSVEDWIRHWSVCEKRVAPGASDTDAAMILAGMELTRRGYHTIYSAVTTTFFRPWPATDRLVDTVDLVLGTSKGVSADKPESVCTTGGAAGSGSGSVGSTGAAAGGGDGDAQDLLIHMDPDIWFARGSARVAAMFMEVFGHMVATPPGSTAKTSAGHYQVRSCDARHGWVTWLQEHQGDIVRFVQHDDDVANTNNNPSPDAPEQSGAAAAAAASTGNGSGSGKDKDKGKSGVDPAVAASALRVSFADPCRFRSWATFEAAGSTLGTGPDTAPTTLGPAIVALHMAEFHNPGAEGAALRSMLLWQGAPKMQLGKGRYLVVTLPPEELHMDAAEACVQTMVAVGLVTNRTVVLPLFRQEKARVCLWEHLFQWEYGAQQRGGGAFDSFILPASYLHHPAMPPRKKESGSASGEDVYLPTEILDGAKIEAELANVDKTDPYLYLRGCNRRFAGFAADSAIQAEYTARVRQLINKPVPDDDRVCATPTPWYPAASVPVVPTPVQDNGVIPAERLRLVYRQK